jgi:hypothetical protein
MRPRIAIWALADALAVGLWWSLSAGNDVESAWSHAASGLRELSGCAARAHPLSILFVIPWNAATNTLAGTVVELTRRHFGPER